MATSGVRSASPPAGRCNPSWIASTPFALSGDTFQTPTYIPAPRSPGGRGRTSARHADCLLLWGWSDNLQAELGRIGIALIPRDQEVFEARRLEDEQDPRRLTLDGESVGEIPRQGRARAAAVLDDPSALRPGQHRFFYCHRWSLLSRWVQVSHKATENWDARTQSPSIQRDDRGDHPTPCRRPPPARRSPTSFAPGTWSTAPPASRYEGPGPASPTQ